MHARSGSDDTEGRARDADRGGTVTSTVDRMSVADAATSSE